MAHLYIMTSFLESPASILNRREIDFEKQSTWIMISLLTLNKLAGCFWSYFVNTSSYIFWFYFKFLTWKRKKITTKLISLGVIENWYFPFHLNLCLISTFGIGGLVLIPDLHCLGCPKFWLDFTLLIWIEEEKIFQLATASGHRFLLLGYHQRSSMIEALSLERQTKMVGA